MDAQEIQQVLARYEVRTRRFDAIAADRHRRAAAPFLDGAESEIPAEEHDVHRALTERELEVLVLISRGESNAEISAQLQIGEETVKTYVKKILVKLRARNRAHAVAIAINDQLLER